MNRYLRLEFGFPFSHSGYTRLSWKHRFAFQRSQGAHDFTAPLAVEASQLDVVCDSSLAFLPFGGGWQEFCESIVTWCDLHRHRDVPCMSAGHSQAASGMAHVGLFQGGTSSNDCCEWIRYAARNGFCILPNNKKKMHGKELGLKSRKVNDASWSNNQSSRGGHFFAGVEIGFADQTMHLMSNKCVSDALCC